MFAGLLFYNLFKKLGPGAHGGKMVTLSHSEKILAEDALGTV